MSDATRSTLTTDRRDGWDPDQYQRFQGERARPFHDLLALVPPVPGGRVVDLGCGTGELTATLHAHLRAASTTGIDSSPAMLERALPLSGAGLGFVEADIASFTGHLEGPCDVVFSNAALQWVEDHHAVLARWTKALAPGGQLAVQVPANLDHRSHTVISEIADEEPFHSAMGGRPPRDVVTSVLRPEVYAELLDELGYVDQHVRLQVYDSRMASASDVVEWTKGTSLVRFRTVLEPELFDRFVERYRTRLIEVLGDKRPYFYAFKRILFWGRLEGGS